MPAQVRPLFQTTAHPAAPSSSRDPSVNMVSPGRSFSTSALASASSSCSNSASRVSGSSSRIVLSVLPAEARIFVSLRPISVGAPTMPRAWSPCGKLSSRRPSRCCLFSSCVAAALSPDSIERAPRLVVRKQPVVARASGLTSSWSSSAADCAWNVVPFPPQLRSKHGD